MAGRTHGTRTPHRMNDALRRDARGFIARQTVATQDLRKAIYVGPFGKGFHKVKNPQSDEEYVVADGIGGATLTPGTPCIVASFSGQHGEVLISRPPAGMGGSSVTRITLPPETSPYVAPEPDGILTFGNYRGWSYYCDGGSYVWLACVHHRTRYLAGPVFVDGTAAVRVAKIAVSAITGNTELALDGYEIGEFLNGVGGTEVFRQDPIALASLSDFYLTVSMISSSGTVFVVYTMYGTTDYVIDCLSDSGSFRGSDTFTGRTYVNTPNDLNKHSAICSSTDGYFYFAHPIGSGDQDFRFCRRSSSDASVQAFVDIDFAAASKVYAGIAERPSATGLRVFANKDDSTDQFYMDFDEDMIPLTGWVAMSFGADNHYETIDSGRSNSTVRVSTGYAVLGINVSGDQGVFLIDHSGAFDAEVGDDNLNSYPPIYKGPSGSFVYGGSATSTDTALRRMLSDGSIA